MPPKMSTRFFSLAGRTARKKPLCTPVVLRKWLKSKKYPASRQSKVETASKSTISISVAITILSVTLPKAKDLSNFRHRTNQHINYVTLGKRDIKNTSDDLNQILANAIKPTWGCLMN